MRMCTCVCLYFKLAISLSSKFVSLASHINALCNAQNYISCSESLRLNLFRYLTGNLLSGPVPDWMLDKDNL